MSLPQKYCDAKELLLQKNEDAYCEYATNNKLDYDIIINCRATVFSLAVEKKLWKPVEFMIGAATPSLRDVAWTYGVAPADVSTKVLDRFMAQFSSGLPRTTDDAVNDQESAESLLAGFVAAGCHLALIQKMIVKYHAPPGTLVSIDDMHIIRKPVAIFVLSSLIQIANAGSEKFLWLAEHHTKGTLAICDELIEEVVTAWSQDLHDFTYEFSKDGPRAASIEKAFWKLDQMHSKKAAFRNIARLLAPDQYVTIGEQRLGSMLACLGVLQPNYYDAKEFEIAVPCEHCKGTGKTIGIDQERAEAAKKRRIETLNK